MSGQGSFLLVIFLMPTALNTTALCRPKPYGPKPNSLKPCTPYALVTTKDLAFWPEAAVRHATALALFLGCRTVPSCPSVFECPI